MTWRQDGMAQADDPGGDAASAMLVEDILLALTNLRATLAWIAGPECPQAMRALAASRMDRRIEYLLDSADRLRSAGKPGAGERLPPLLLVDPLLPAGAATPAPMAPVPRPAFVSRRAMSPP
jgi:hypothetical protein